MSLTTHRIYSVIMYYNTLDITEPQKLFICNTVIRTVWRRMSTDNDTQPSHRAHFKNLIYEDLSTSVRLY